VSNLTSSSWMEALAEEVKAIAVEAAFTVRDVVLQGKHAIGKAIAESDGFRKYAKGNSQAFNRLAELSGVSASTLYRSLQFYELYPDLALLPGGKEMSWNRVVTNLLPGDGRKAREVGTWTKVKTLMDCELEGLSKGLQRRVTDWRDTADVLYDDFEAERGSSTG
jgi:hypothetical protein